MKIYTKTGDQGSTSLFGGQRLPKSDLRIETYGTIDELNSFLGLLRDQPVNANRKEILIEIQDRLFTIGSILATEPGNTKVKIPALSESDVVFLEKEIDKMDEQHNIAFTQCRNFYFGVSGLGGDRKSTRLNSSH